MLLIAGDVVLAFAETTPSWRCSALSLQGIAFGVSWPASQSLIAAAVPSELRQRYFGVNFTLLNLGIGIGGIIGGLFVDVDEPVTFQAIYLADAVSYLPILYLLLVPLRHVAGRPVHDRRRRPPAPSPTSQVLRRPAVATGGALSFVSSLRRLLPAQRRHAGVRPRRRRGLDPGPRASPSPPTPW